MIGKPMKNRTHPFFPPTSRQTRSRSKRLLCMGLFLTGWMLLWLPKAEAQMMFSADMTDEVRQTLDEREDIDAEVLYELVSEGLRLRYEGEEAVSARFLVFFMSADGALQGTLTSESFDLEPGEEPRGEMVPREDFLNLFEEAAVVGGYPSIPTAPTVMDIDASSPVIYEFEDAWLERDETWPSKWGYIWAQTLASGIERGDASGAIGFALVPGLTPYFLDIIGRYIDPETEAIDPDAEIKVRYITVMNRAN
jgi:hypothetical protein